MPLHLSKLTGQWEVIRSLSRRRLRKAKWFSRAQRDKSSHCCYFLQFPPRINRHNLGHTDFSMPLLHMAKGPFPTLRCKSNARGHSMTTNLSRNCRWATLAGVVTLFAALTVDPAWGQQPAQSTQAKPRIEKDLLGEKEIPADAYYGVQTARALENFQLSGVPINHYPGFVEEWAIVKLAAAQANTDVGAMKMERLAAIEKACLMVLAGKYHD